MVNRLNRLTRREDEYKTNRLQASERIAYRNIEKLQTVLQQRVDCQPLVTNLQKIQTLAKKDPFCYGMKVKDGQFKSIYRISIK